MSDFKKHSPNRIGYYQEEKQDDRLRRLDVVPTILRRESSARTASAVSRTSRNLESTLISRKRCHFAVSEASVERLRKFLLPLELAEAELKTKPAAAVLIILREGPEGLEVLLGERRKREGDPWSGQIGLPGGRHHVEDGTLLSTALRETREEVGIDVGSAAETLGHMAPRAPGNKPELLVVPYVAIATAPLEATPGPEMTSVFWVPLSALPATQGKTLVPTILGELNVPSYTPGDRLIWGFTYRILEELLVFVGLSA